MEFLLWVLWLNQVGRFLRPRVVSCDEIQEEALGRKSTTNIAGLSLGILLLLLASLKNALVCFMPKTENSGRVLNVKPWPTGPKSCSASVRPST